jgi:hypothetical protein
MRSDLAVSEDQYKQLHSWLEDLDHAVKGNGVPGLRERMVAVEGTVSNQGREIGDIKQSLEKKSDRQWYLLLTILAAVAVDIAQHWATQHIK